MWLLTLLPNSLMYFIVVAICILGVVGYLIGTFNSIIPVLTPHAIVIKHVSIVVMIVGVYLYGGYTTEMKWRNQSEVLNQKIILAEEKSKTATAQVVIKYKDRIKVIHDTKVVTKEVLREKVVAVDSCNVPVVVEVLNKAARNPLNLSVPAEVAK